MNNSNKKDNAERELVVKDDSPGIQLEELNQRT